MSPQDFERRLHRSGLKAKQPAPQLEDISHPIATALPSSAVVQTGNQTKRNTSEQKTQPRPKKKANLKRSRAESGPQLNGTTDGTREVNYGVQKKRKKVADSGRDLPKQKLEAKVGQAKEQAQTAAAAAETSDTSSSGGDPAAAADL